VVQTQNGDYHPKLTIKNIAKLLKLDVVLKSLFYLGQICTQSVLLFQGQGGGRSAEITMQIYCTRDRNLWPHFRYIISEAGKYTDKKENQIFLIYKEIQSEAVAKSYMYEEGLPKIKI
jgi:hypothetical protein